MHDQTCALADAGEVPRGSSGAHEAGHLTAAQ